MDSGATAFPGHGYARRGREPEALESTQAAAALAAALLRGRPEDPARRANIARDQPDLAALLLRRGEAPQALELARGARRTFEALIAAEGHDSRYHRELLTALGMEARFAMGDRDAEIESKRARRAAAFAAADPGNRAGQLPLLLH
jgi:hypothetical protein